MSERRGEGEGWGKTPFQIKEVLCFTGSLQRGSVGAHLNNKGSSRVQNRFLLLNTQKSAFLNSVSLLCNYV